MGPPRTFVGRQVLYRRSSLSFQRVDRAESNAQAPAKKASIICAGSGRIDTGIEEAAAYVASRVLSGPKSRAKLPQFSQIQPSSKLRGGPVRIRATRAWRWTSLTIFLARISGTLLGSKNAKARQALKSKLNILTQPTASGQQAFIGENGDAGFDLYFSPNPIKGTLHKKAGKNDILEARHLWVDLDPCKGEPLEAERDAMLAGLRINLPDGLPKPNRVTDSVSGLLGILDTRPASARRTAAKTM